MRSNGQNDCESTLKVALCDSSIIDKQMSSCPYRSLIQNFSLFWSSTQVLYCKCNLTDQIINPVIGSSSKINKSLQSCFLISCFVWPCYRINAKQPKLFFWNSTQNVRIAHFGIQLQQCKKLTQMSQKVSKWNHFVNL